MAIINDQHNPQPADLPEPPGRPEGGSRRSPANERLWLGLAALTLRSWPATLRVAFLLAVALTGVALILCALGLVGEFPLITIGFWPEGGYHGNR